MIDIELREIEGYRKNGDIKNIEGEIKNGIVGGIGKS